MAVPSNARILRGIPLKTGVILGVSPSSDPTFDVEFARATSSGVYATVARLSPKGAGIPVSYTDLLPDDNTIRLYKARAVKDGWDPGDYTSAVSAKPIILPEVSPNITPLTGKGIGSPLFISTGAPPTYGRAASTAAYDKTLTIYPFEFLSTDNAVAYGASPAAIYPTAAASRTWYWKSVLSSGAVFDRFTMAYRRAGVGGVVRFRIQLVGSTGGGITTIHDYTATGVGGYHEFTSTFAFAFGGNTLLFGRLDITSTSGTTASAQLNRVTIPYRQTNLSVGV